MALMQFVVNFVVFLFCAFVVVIAWNDEMKYIFDQEDREKYVTKEGIITFISSAILGLMELTLITMQINQL